MRLARTALAGARVADRGGADRRDPQAVLWIAGAGDRLLGPFVFGVRGFRVSPAHFAERFSLIVIIALGESIVAIGTGIGSDLDAGTIVAALVGLVLACALWWAYFDVVALFAEDRFREATGHERSVSRATPTAICTCR